MREGGGPHGSASYPTARRRKSAGRPARANAYAIGRVTLAMTMSFRSLFVVLASAWVVAMTSAVTATQGAVPLAALDAQKSAAPGNSAPPGRFDMAVIVASAAALVPRSTSFGRARGVAAPSSIRNTTP